ncbi:hypothetical protein IB260_00020 [Pseudomonas sp. PDM23]|uniref:hypothetical protein n=1 Tax=unclassified Pseudomonas TaxID=196821 RepID=UPI00177B49E6|nr:MULTISPECIES: hypothetical protein [unclassified Pseudomonas]MBD9573682.1 hypothetical protein [Pseudomonas sp. PDM23]MBD9675032.1 hypothetical protein [Pseudomonas sp. PDM21]
MTIPALTCSDLTAEAYAGALLQLPRRIMGGSASLGAELDNQKGVRLIEEKTKPPTILGGSL